MHAILIVNVVFKLLTSSMQDRNPVVCTAEGGVHGQPREKD
jgi:hypothetical protein